MAKVQLEVEIKGGDTVEKASGKVQTLRTELFKLKEQLASGQLTGAELAQAEVRAKDLTKAISETNKYIRGLASDTPLLNGFVGVAEGIVGGFTAAQGAMALFGSENEDVQKTLIKVQGAVATLNGFQAVANALQKESSAMIALSSARLKVVTFLQQRYTAAVGTATGAMKAFRIAGMALGIGVIISLIGALIANFDKLKAVVTRFIPGLESLSKWFNIAKNAVTDFLGITSDQTRAYDALEQATEKQITATEREIELLKARGASIKEIWLAERSIIDMRLKLLQEQVRLNGKLNEQQLKDAEELQHQKRVLDETYYKDKRDAEKKDEKRGKERKKKEKEELKQEQQDSHVQRYEEWKKIQQQRQDQFDEAFAQLESERDEEFWANERAREREKQSELDYNIAVTKAEDELVQAKRGALEAGLNMAQEFAGKNKAIADTLFAVQKGVAIAQVIIDLQKEIASISATTAATFGAAAPAVAAPSILAAKIRAATSIATIAATTIGKFAGGGGRGATGGGGGGTPTRSQQPNVPTFTTNNNRQQTGGTERIKVYVTETDIRNVSNRTSSIYSQAQVE